MCEPSVSWSAIIITELYLKSLVFVYVFPKLKPMILTILANSKFYITCLIVISLTLKTFPLKGKTP